MWIAASFKTPKMFFRWGGGGGVDKLGHIYKVDCDLPIVNDKCDEYNSINESLNMMLMKETKAKDYCLCFGTDNHMLEREKPQLPRLN